MSGSSESDDDLVSGRVNRSNDLTAIWVENSDDDGPYSSGTMFLVQVSDGPDETWDDDPSGWIPKKVIDGIVGIGWSGSPAKTGGVGVTGHGGASEGTGVLGEGGGVNRAGEQGIGGIGVRGHGGDLIEGFPSVVSTTPPGAGVLGQGGRRPLNDNVDRLPHAPGVVGVGGGSKKPVPTPADTGSVGVFGQGAEAEVTTVTIEGVVKTVGPLAPGAGVVGRGGVPNLPEMPVGAGVIGVAGGTALPTPFTTDNVGVFGEGKVGVRGRSDTVTGVDGVSKAGTGVLGTSEGGTGVQGVSELGPGVQGFGRGGPTGQRSDRGGIFGSFISAQLQLIPHELGAETPNPLPITPKAIPSAPKLPKDGRVGDVLALVDVNKDCTLWFCVRGIDPMGPAQWAQVLLGPPFTGVA